MHGRNQKNIQLLNSYLTVCLQLGKYREDNQCTFHSLTWLKNHPRFWSNRADIWQYFRFLDCSNHWQIKHYSVSDSVRITQNIFMRWFTYYLSHWRMQFTWSISSWKSASNLKAFAIPFCPLYRKARINKAKESQFAMCNRNRIMTRPIFLTFTFCFNFIIFKNSIRIFNEARRLGLFLRIILITIIRKHNNFNLFFK